MKSSIVRDFRAVQRFTVNLPVVLNWRAVGRPDRSIRGLTRDISTRGMFVLAAPGPLQGELVEFEIDLAFDESSPLVLVEGEGRVVRVENRSTSGANRSGFAVHNLWFKLREPEEGQAIAPTIPTGPAAKARAQAGPRRLSIVPQKRKPDSGGTEKSRSTSRICMEGERE